MNARVIRVIEVIDSVGKGTMEDPVRIVKYFFAFDGALLATWDPVAEERNVMANAPDAADQA